MSGTHTPTKTPPSTPEKRSYNPIFFKAKVLIEASKAGDVQTIEELCRDVCPLPRLSPATSLWQSFSNSQQGQDVNTRTLLKQESPLHKVFLS